MDKISPFLKSPLSDITGSVFTSQFDPRCSGFEMRAIECLEAYGVERGMKSKCKALVDDYYECLFHCKKSMRVYEMRTERHKQYRNGERKEHYAPPPTTDSL